MCASGALLFCTVLLPFYSFLFHYLCVCLVIHFKRKFLYIHFRVSTALSPIYIPIFS